MQREMLPDSFGSAYQSIIISHDVHIALQYTVVALNKYTLTTMESNPNRPFGYL